MKNSDTIIFHTEGKYGKTMTMIYNGAMIYIIHL